MRVLRFLGLVVLALAFWCAVVLLVLRLTLTDQPVPYTVEIAAVGWGVTLSYLVALLVPPVYREGKVWLARWRIDRDVARTAQLLAKPIADARRRRW